MLALAISIRRLIAACLLLSFASPIFAGDVLRIAGDGSEDYFSISDAYASAQSGDTLLVIRAPMDSDFAFDTKGVTLVSLAGTSWEAGLVTVRFLAAGETAVLRGLYQVDGNLDITDNDGSILVTDCTLEGIVVENSRDVAFARCQSKGMDGIDSYYGLYAEMGLLAVASTILLEDCDLEGGRGTPESCGSGFCMTCCTGGGNGTAGLGMSAGSFIRAQSCTFRGGPPGFQGGGCNCGTFTDGWGFWINPMFMGELVLLDSPTLSSQGDFGVATVLADTPRSALLPNSVTSGSSLSLDLKGELGDTVFLLLGGNFGFQSNTLGSGFVQVDQSTGRRRIRSLPPGGDALSTLIAPTVPAGEVVGIPYQLGFLRPNGQVRFAPAGVLDVRGAGVPAW
jgi:hypothetical protein